MNNGIITRAAGVGAIGPRAGIGGFDPRLERGYPPGDPRWDFAAWKAAWTRQRNGQGTAHIVCIGDSTTEGTGASSWATTWPSVLSSRINAVTQVDPGTGWVPPYVKANGYTPEERIVLTNTWRSNTGYGPYINAVWSDVAPGDTYVTFTPTQPVSQFSIYYAQNTLADGTWQAEVDGVVVAGPFATGQPAGRYVVTVDCPGGLGEHDLVVRHSSYYTRQYLVAVEGIASTSSGVKVSKLGRWGYQLGNALNNASNFGTNSNGSLEYIWGATDPDLMLISFGLNEMNNSVTTEAFRLNLETAAGLCRDRGISCILVVGAPPDPAWAGPSKVWDNYAAVIRSTAVRLNTGLIDFTARFGSYSNNTSYYADQVHPSSLGYAEMGRIAAEVVLAPVI